MITSRLARSGLSRHANQKSLTFQNNGIKEQQFVSSQCASKKPLISFTIFNVQVTRGIATATSFAAVGAASCLIYKGRNFQQQHYFHSLNFRSSTVWEKCKRKFFSSSTSTKKQIKNSNQKTRTSLKWRSIARTVKNIRIPFLVLSVYGIGYQQGVIDYARDPKTKEMTLLGTVFAGVGASASSDRIMDQDARTKQIQRVGNRLTSAAKKHVENEMKRVTNELLEKILSSHGGMSQESLNEVFDKEASENDEVQFWIQAEQHMNGYGEDWQYILIKSKTPNAFVAEILPHRIFITTSMIEKLVDNDDEMALIFGHELSHLILGHVSEENKVETFLHVFEVLLLSLDPTEGVMSLGLMGFLSTIRKALSAAHSQDHERQADELGIKLAAMACYDTKKASEVFRKLYELENESGDTGISSLPLVSFFESHPPSEERYEYLLSESANENSAKYKDDGCGAVTGRFMQILQKVRKNGQEDRHE